MIIDNRFDLAICQVLDFQEEYKGNNEYSTADLINAYKERDTIYSSILEMSALTGYNTQKSELYTSPFRNGFVESVSM